jgi:hypothetical protein
MKMKLPEIILTRLLALIVESEVTKHSFNVYTKAKTFLLRSTFPYLLSDAYARKRLFEIPVILTSVTS